MDFQQSYEKNIRTKEEVVADIKVAKQIFNEGSAVGLQGTRGLDYFERDGFRYFGVEKDGQNFLDFVEVKKTILQKLGMSADTPIVQVVGDSDWFTEAGALFAKNYVFKDLNANKNALVLYGFTGHRSQEPEKYDVNGIVNEWMSQDSERADRVLANIVDSATVGVIEKYKCDVSLENKNFYLVHGDANFGDDVLSSDMITDKVICLEGGIQSLRQVINCIHGDAPATCLYNLRDPQKNMLSAAGFLKTFVDYANEMNLDVKDLTNGQVAMIIDQYKKERDLLFDPTRHDAGTKSHLFNEAIEMFINEEVWRKLNLCEFIAFEPNVVQKSSWMNSCNIL
jgi:hypothetical protein